MNFSSPLIEATFLKRYKRFFVDAQLENGEIITAHTANTGSMKTALQEGFKLALSYDPNPKRKLKYSLQLTHNHHCWIGVNTHLPNKLVKEALLEGKIKELNPVLDLKEEVTINQKSRLDFLLNDQIYLEVKNVSMREEGSTRALFPDSVSERATKHLHELMDLKSKGFRAVCLFVVQRTDVDCFSPAEMIDPVYAETFKLALDKGVEMLCYQFHCDLKGIYSLGPLPIRISS